MVIVFNESYINSNNQWLKMKSILSLPSYVQYFFYIRSFTNYKYYEFKYFNFSFLKWMSLVKIRQHSVIKISVKELKKMMLPIYNKKKILFL